VKQIFPVLFCLYGMLAAAQTATLATDAIRVRDPFIFADAPSQTYYLYAQAANRAGSGYQGVEVYTSTDLKTWKAPRPVLTLPADSGVAMVWSTFIPGKEYCVLLARSASGLVAGPWTGHTPLYTTNGGHGMIFKTFEGRLRLALHQPNNSPHERLHLLNLTDDSDILRLENE